MVSTRRNFMSTVGTLSAATLMGTSRESAASKKKRTASRGKLLRIGVLTCHPTHHHMPNTWSYLINCVTDSSGYTPTRMTTMELTHIWEQDKQTVEMFCKKFGTKPVNRYDDMVDKVDGVIISDTRSIDHFPELAAPYLKAGIPVLFNRPFISSLGSAKKIIALSEKHGTPFLAPSAWEYTKEIYVMRRKMDELGPGIRGVTVYNTSHEVTHDYHGVCLLLAMVGTGVESVSVVRNAETIHSRGTDTWTIKFKERNNNPPFYATLNNSNDPDSNAWIKVIFKKGTFEQNLWKLAGTEANWLFYNVPMLLEFQKMIETDEMSQSHGHNFEKASTFLAGLKSLLKLNGRPALISELEDDFHVRMDPEVTQYPDGMFG